MSITLPSVKVVKHWAFSNTALTYVKFGSILERIVGAAFMDCPNLEQITIPLKDGIIDNGIFRECEELERVDLVEGSIHETIVALLLEEWRNDMYEEINSINQILPTARAGETNENGFYEDGDKARVIQTWIRSVLCKVIHYKAEHHRLVDEAATTLQLTLPQDIVMNNVLPFLELPSYIFEVVDHEEADHEHGEDDSDEEDGRRDVTIWCRLCCCC